MAPEAPWPRILAEGVAIVACAAALTGCQRAPPLNLAPPGALPDLIGIVTREGDAIQVGDARFEGDSVLVGDVWPDSQSWGWRQGEAFRLPLAEVAAAISLADVGARVWEVLSAEDEQSAVRWQDVYVFAPRESIPQSCSRVALLFQRPLRFSGGWDGRFEPGPEQARVGAGQLGANAVYLSWLETDSRDGLFGPDWDYPAALAVRCPGLTAPAEPRQFGGGG